MQKPQIIDITKSYLPGDPNSYPENLISTDREDGEEKTMPVLPFEAYNVLPTAYGYRSYFGADSTLVGDAAPANCDQIILFQKNDYSNMMIAFTAAGVYTRTGTATAWTQTFALTDTWTASGIYKEYTWTILDNDLYIYRQGHTHVLKILYDGTTTTFVPTFLNMAGQMGIFKAHGRLGFWDSLNSVSWSSALDYTNFTPDLETLAGNCTFLEVQGRIVTIKDHGEGYVIYATKSIVGIGYNTQGTQLWDAMALTQAGGIGYTRAVVMGENNKQHFAYTSIGIFMIGHFNALSRQYDMQQIAPELFDFLKESRDPVYLDCFAGRYLHFGLLHENYLNGLTSFVSNSNGDFASSVIGSIPFTSDVQFNGDNDFPVLTIQGAAPNAFLISGGKAAGYDGTYLDFTSESSLITSLLTDNKELTIDFELVSTAIANGTQVTLNLINLSAGAAGEFTVDFIFEKATGGWIINSALIYQRITGTADYIDVIEGLGSNFVFPDDISFKYRRYDGRMEAFLNDVSIGSASYLTSLSFTPTVTTTSELLRTTAPHALACYYVDLSIKELTSTPTNIIALDWDAATGSDFPFASSINVDNVDNTFPKNSTTFDPRGAYTFSTDAQGSWLVSDPIGESIWNASTNTIQFDLYVKSANMDIAGEHYIYIAYYKTAAPGEFYMYLEIRPTGAVTAPWNVYLHLLTPELVDVGTTTLIFTDFKFDQFNQLRFEKHSAALHCFLNGGEGSAVVTPGASSNWYPTEPVEYTGAVGGSLMLYVEPSYEIAAAGLPRIAIKNVLFQEGIAPYTSYFSFPGSEFKLQTGSISPAYPEILGSLVFDLQLKKWGKNLNSHRCLIALSPLNETQNQTISYTNFGVDSGMLKYSDRTIRLFSAKVLDSLLKYGKIGFYRQGFSVAQEVILHFRIPSTGTVTVEGSLNGKELDTRVETSTDFTEAVEVVVYPDKSARWFNIAISGQFDLTYLEFRGTIAGRR